MKVNEVIQPTNPHEVQKSKDIVAYFPKEEFKAWFYLLSGKPDSTVKFFNGDISISPEDIIELNNDVQLKLQTHNIDSCITTVSIAYSDNTVKEFGTWGEFQTHHWNRPESTESILVKWDFLVSIKGYEIPQRHMLTIRISSDVQPFHLLHAMFLSKAGSFEEIEKEVSPVYCRVDFINQSLGQELVKIVSDWHAGRKKSRELSIFLQKIKVKRLILARFIHYSLPFLTGCLALSLLFYCCLNIHSTQVATVSNLKWFFSWLFSAGFITLFIANVGKRVGATVFRAIDDYGNFRRFIFTNGDKNKQDELDKRDKKLLSKFLWRTIVVILYDILIALLTAKIIG
ncbi:MAG: hypothetical protein PHW79_08955 [Candidatus Marinimicrobia bacterium]|nr:hypothetical protein [Candidatus Neomarinimicrobiota bacterium]